MDNDEKARNLMQCLGYIKWQQAALKEKQREIQLLKSNEQGLKSKSVHNYNQLASQVMQKECEINDLNVSLSRSNEEKQKLMVELKEKDELINKFDAMQEINNDSGFGEQNLTDNDETQEQYPCNDDSGLGEQNLTDIAETQEQNARKQPVAIQQNEFKCEEPNCSKSYKKKESFNRHKQRHKTRLDCPEPNCNYWFSQTSDLKRHMLRHSGAKPFSCSVCLKQFSTKSNLKQHSKVHN